MDRISYFTCTLPVSNEPGYTIPNAYQYLEIIQGENLLFYSIAWILELPVDSLLFSIV